jgi:hypothetical protein
LTGLSIWEADMAGVATWESEFTVWDYSVSYSRLLLRSLQDSSPSRVDVLFSNVLFMHMPTSFSACRSKCRRVGRSRTCRIRQSGVGMS